MTVYILGIACAILLCAIALVFIMFYGGFNGNVYLSLYLFGIMIGNSRIRNKQMLIPFLMV